MNQYKLVKKLGNGSFGTVFLAEVKNSNPKQFVALKRIKCDTLEQANESMKEIWPLRNLIHPNLIQCIDFFLDKSYASSPSLRRSFSSSSQFSPRVGYTETNSNSSSSEEFAATTPPTSTAEQEDPDDDSIPLYVCFVLEYANGGDLSQYIKQFKNAKRTIPMHILFQFCENLFEALICLHSHRLIHRDIKPQNVLLCKQANNSNDDIVFKLADFGYLKQLQQNNSYTTNSIVGTAQYNSVELMSKKPYNEKTDIWSLGVVLFEMLTLQTEQVLYMELITNEKGTIEWVKEQINQQGYSSSIWYDQLLCKMICVDASKRANATECLFLVKKLQKRAYFELLPATIWLQIFSFLDAPQLCHETNLVTKQFYHLCLASQLWKNLYTKSFEEFCIEKYTHLLRWKENEIRKWFHWKQLYHMRLFYERKVVMEETYGVSLGSPLKTQPTNTNKDDWQNVEYSEFDEHETKLLHIFRIEELERNVSNASLSIEQKVRLFLEQAILFSKIGATQMASQKQTQARKLYKHSPNGAKLVFEDVKANVEVGRNKVISFLSNLKTKVFEFIDPTSTPTKTTPATPKSSISPPTRPSTSSTPSRNSKSVSIHFPFHSSITIGNASHDLFADAALAEAPSRKSLDGTTLSNQSTTPASSNNNNTSSSSSTPIKAKQHNRTRQSTGFFGISFPISSASTPPHYSAAEDVLSRSLDQLSSTKTQQEADLFKEEEE